MKTMLTFYSKWAAVYRSNLPMRRQVKQSAEDMIESRKYRLLKYIFGGLKAVSIGEFSTRKANAVRRGLVEEIRRELSEKYKSQGQLGVVPESEIFQALLKKVLIQFQSTQRTLKLQSTFGAFVSIKTLARSHFMKALKHHFCVLAGRSFYAWSDYVYLISQGLDRKRWPGARKYEVKYNQKKELITSETSLVKEGFLELGELISVFN